MLLMFAQLFKLTLQFGLHASHIYSIGLVQGVQRQLTHRILPNLSFHDRLQFSNLQSLEEQRIHFDLFLLFHVLHTAEFGIKEHFVFMHTQRLGLKFCYKYCLNEFLEQF